MAQRTNTEYERLALANRINLSDGHARQELTPNQRAIVDGMSALVDLVADWSQPDIESRFADLFFEAAGQRPGQESLRTFFAYSSSSAIKMGAQFCRLHGLRVVLIEPCFDNIRHLLVTEGVPVTPVSEELLSDPEQVAALLDDQTVLWLVQPNNPTGFCLDPARLRQLIWLVAERGATLVLDFCFRFFSPSLGGWAQYAELAEAGGAFLCFEDTGKTWSLFDIKVGISVCSPCAAPTIHRLHDELLLNVSPLHLLLLSAFIEDTRKCGTEATYHGVVRRNREVIHAVTEAGIVQHVSPHCTNVPMELLGLPPEVSAEEFWALLRRRGVDVLPGRNYYWSDSRRGNRLFRIPLARPEAHIRAAAPLIAATAAEFV